MEFPIWQYLKQPVFSANYKTILNPRRFWRSYQINYLEKCWHKAFRPEERFH
ncbi:MAG: hypothetical protein F6K04_16425 [Leptolyngbya sp. SIO4C5]|uniref:hypothetical protein n=1 Tax=Sphaerothrix gracilis TaxID=3151835 RepID=UPI0013C20260|nr:hypothetical protein [Leptolyngbya sp. SIO4C5]